MSKIKMNNKQNIENHLIALVRRGANNITKLAITRQTQMGGNRVNAVQCAVHIKRREHRTQKNSKQNPVSKQVVGNSEWWKVETIRYDIVTQQANKRKHRRFSVVTDIGACNLIHSFIGSSIESIESLYSVRITLHRRPQYVECALIPTQTCSSGYCRRRVPIQSPITTI